MAQGVLCSGTAVGGIGPILHTTDGGTTWTNITPDTLGTFWGVCFTDGNTGTVVGVYSQGATILRTTDGGTTW